MAAIGRIRKHSGLLIAIIGIALAAFVLGDLFKSSGSRKNIPVGIVNGEEITYREFNQNAEQNLENQRQSSQTGNLTDQQRFQVRKATWDQMVKDIILQEQYDNLGLAVSPDELYDLVQGTEPHPLMRQYFQDPNTGQFNPDMVRQFLGNLNQMDQSTRQQWLSLEKYIKEDQLQKKFNNLILKSYYLPDSLAKMNYMDKGKSADITYFGVKYQTVADDEVEVTDADYEKYYAENKYRFYNYEENRKLDYVIFEVNASEEDLQEIVKQVKNLYAEMEETSLEETPAFVNSVSDVPYDSSWKTRTDLSPTLEKALFDAEKGTSVDPYLENNAYRFAKLVDIAYRPDSMKASHILIAFQGAARAETSRTADEAQKLADSLHQVLKKNPSKFEALAKEYSDGPTGINGGDLGWFADGAMVPAFNKAVLETKKGNITQAQTQFGFHVIKVTGKKKPVRKVRIAEVVYNITPSSKTYQDVYMKASAFSGENPTYEAFNQAVEEQGLNKRSTPSLTKMTGSIAGLDEPRQLIRWAFDSETQLHDVSKVFEESDKFIVATLSEINPKGYLSLKAVKEQIQPLVLREKKAAVILKKIDETGATDIRTMANKLGAEIKKDERLSFNTDNIKGFGREPEIVAKIFNLEPGTTSSPMQGNMAVYVIQVNKFSFPPEIKNFTGTKKSMERDFLRNGRRIYESLQQQADIENNSTIAF